MGDLGQASTYYIPDPIAGEEGENDEEPIRYYRHSEKKDGRDSTGPEVGMVSTAAEDLKQLGDALRR